MSGHSKWASIKRKKSATDEKRGRMFSKLLRAIEVAAREGGANVDGNMTLASAVQKARDYSVPVEPGQVESILRLVEGLEDLEDVQSVYSNFDIPEELLVQAG